uniref:SHSP domain-containing protein n=1 Tax=Ditylenchus dipsaci TaxID=166011 RepID=A0A915CP30_9BILA
MSSEPKKMFENYVQQIRTKKRQESPIETLISTSKYTLTIDMHIFKAEDIQVLMQKGQLTIQAEQEVKLNEKTSVVRRFVRRLTLPEDVNVEVFTTEMNS